MFQKAISEMRGDAVHASDGRIGTLDDLYFDRESWQVRYLVVELARGSRMLISAGCATSAARPGAGLQVQLSRAQMDLDHRVAPAGGAAGVLDMARVCSARRLAYCKVEAVDGRVGLVADLVVDDEAWSIDYLLMSPAWAQSRSQILLPLDWVKDVDFARSAMRLHCTSAQLFSAPKL